MAASAILQYGSNESESLSVGDSSSDHVQAQAEHLQSVSDQQLAQLVADTIRANEVLATETEMFEKHLKRVDPRDMLRSLQVGPGGQSHQRQAFGSVATLSSQSDTGGQAGGGGSRMSRKSRSKSRTSGADRSLRLSAEQKCDIAQREIDEYQLEVRKMNEEAEKVLDNLRAIAEAADVRLSEIRQEQYEFDRDILGKDQKKKKIPVSSEKLVKYIEDRLRDRDSLIVKLRLKNTALKVTKKKLQMQLKQKEEMGEVLHEIDFSQLKIENQQYIERIDERNKDLLRLKLMAGNTLTVLNAHKKRLGTLLLESDRLKVDTTSRLDLLGRIDAETRTVEEEKNSAEKTNRKLRQQMQEYRVPDVMDYVREKAALQNLQKQNKIWERKVDIAEMALRTNRKTWRQIQVSSSHQPQSVQWRPQNVT